MAGILVDKFQSADIRKQRPPIQFTKYANLLFGLAVSHFAPKTSEIAKVVD